MSKVRCRVDSNTKLTAKDSQSSLTNTSFHQHTSCNFTMTAESADISVNTAPMKVNGGVLESSYRALSIGSIISSIGRFFVNRSGQKEV